MFSENSGYLTRRKFLTKRNTNSLIGLALCWMLGWQCMLYGTRIKGQGGYVTTYISSIYQNMYVKLLEFGLMSELISSQM